MLPEKGRRIKPVLQCLLACLLACQANAAELCVQLPEPYKQKLLIEQLNRAKIQFHLSAEGAIKFDSRDYEKVSEISRAVQVHNLSEATSLSFAHPLQQQIFVSLLDEGSISYEIVNSLERDWIVWDKADNEKVKQLQAEASREFAQRIREKFQSRPAASQ